MNWKRFKLNEHEVLLILMVKFYVMQSWDKKMENIVNWYHIVYGEYDMTKKLYEIVLKKIQITYFKTNSIFEVYLHKKAEFKRQMQMGIYDDAFDAEDECYETKSEILYWASQLAFIKLELPLLELFKEGDEVQLGDKKCEIIEAHNLWFVCAEIEGDYCVRKHLTDVAIENYEVVKKYMREFS